MSFIFVVFPQIDLLDPKDKRIMSSCFEPNYWGEDSTGWCATCDPEAKRGQRGYCGPGDFTMEEEAPVIYPNSTNWGFCNKNCLNRNGDENMLQARVDFISIRHLKLQFLKVDYPDKLAFFQTTAEKLRNVTVRGMVFWSRKNLAAQKMFN